MLQNYSAGMLVTRAASIPAAYIAIDVPNR